MIKIHFAIAMIMVCVLGLRYTIVAQEHDHGKHQMKTTQSKEQAKAVYTCPMHPEVVSNKPGKCPKCGMNLQKMDAKSSAMEQMMGTPTFEQKVDNWNISIWLTTQAEHKKMMKESMNDSTSAGKMGHDMMGEKMDHEMMKEMKDMETMMAGTHHIMVAVTDERSGKETGQSKIEIRVASPTKKSSSVTLKKMMNHFGGGLTFDEKGKYLLTATITTTDGAKKTTQFEYEVK